MRAAISLCASRDLAFERARVARAAESSTRRFEQPRASRTRERARSERFERGPSRGRRTYTRAMRSCAGDPRLISLGCCGEGGSRATVDSKGFHDGRSAALPGDRAHCRGRHGRGVPRRKRRHRRFPQEGRDQAGAAETFGEPRRSSTCSSTRRGSARYLSHSKCVQVFDIGQAAGAHFIVMEYVDGADLQGVLEYLSSRGERMSVAAAVPDHDAGLRGARLRARRDRPQGRDAQHRAPRHLPAQRAHDALRRGEARGLRPREGELAPQRRTTKTS